MSDLEQIRDALESAKTFLGQEILWKESNYVRGHGEKKYSELCVALSIIDRMIETPAPQDAPMLTGDIKVGVTTFRQGVKLSTVQACIDSHINSMPKTAPQGWKLVPIEPTAGMYTKGAEILLNLFGDDPYYIKTHKKWALKIYKAMLSAAPIGDKNDG